MHLLPYYASLYDNILAKLDGFFSSQPVSAEEYCSRLILAMYITKRLESCGRVGSDGELYECANYVQF